MSDLSISPGLKVSMHYTLKLAEDGRELETTEDGEAITFVVGDGTLVPGFERAIEGLVAGDEHTQELSPDEGYGHPNEENTHRMSLGQFPDDIELKEGQWIDFKAPNGENVPGLVLELDSGEVRMDFNHPLSGHDLILSVRILDVSRVTKN